MQCEMRDLFPASDADSHSEFSVRLPAIAEPPSRLPEELAHLPPCGAPDTIEWVIDERPTRICKKHALPSELYRLSDDEGRARIAVMKARVAAEIVLRLSEIELEQSQ